MAVGEVRIEGLSRLQRGLKGVSNDAAKDLHDELKEIGSDVARLAQSKAESNISHIGASWTRGSLQSVGAPWARMRVGVTTNTVYIVPYERGRLSRGQPSYRRPKFGDILVERAMQPAADEKRAETTVKVELMLDRLEFKYGLK